VTQIAFFDILNSPVFLICFLSVDDQRFITPDQHL